MRTSSSRLEQLDVDLAGPLGGHERVVGDHLHAEGERPLGDELADAAEADDAERLVGQLDALPLRPLPAARRRGRRGPAGCCGPGRAACAMVCSAVVRMFDCGALTTITPCVVAASASTLSSPMPARPTTTRSWPGGQHVGGDRGGRADDQGVGARHGLDQLLRGQVELEVDLVAGGAEAVEAAVGDLLGDEDARHGRRVWSPPGETRQPVSGSREPDSPTRPTAGGYCAAVSHDPTRRLPCTSGPCACASALARPRPAHGRLRQRRRHEHRRHDHHRPTTTAPTDGGDADASQVAARRRLPGGEGRRRRGARRLHRPPGDRHRQDRRPHVQPVRLRGHAGRGRVLRLRDRLHRDRVRGGLRQEHRHGPRGRPRRA